MADLPGADPQTPTVIVVGLGPAGPEQLTGAARTALTGASRVLVRTARHQAADEWIVRGAVSLDEYYDDAETFESAYQRIVERVITEATQFGRVHYAVPGSPNVLERTVELLRADERIRIESIAGLSFMDLAFERLGIDPVTSHVRLIDAASFSNDAAHDPGPFLVAQLWSTFALSDLKLSVDNPPSEPVVILHHLGLSDEQIVHCDWNELDRFREADHLTCCYVPALAEPVGFEIARLIDLVGVLRERCPWDKEQTHQSLVRHLLEESYEVIESIEELGDDPALWDGTHLEEELGDLLVQVLFHARLATEEGLFGLADVARTCHDKLVHRHPHVFGEVSGVDSPDAVMTRWEEIKRLEKGRSSLMEGIPKALPALLFASKIERKARSVDLGIASTGSGDDGLGELLEQFLAGDFSVAGELLLGIARRTTNGGVDPEEVLRQSATSLMDRFVRAEQAATATGVSLSDAPVTQRQALWAAVGQGTD